jgi:MFS family permease
VTEQWQKNLYVLWAAQFLAMVGLSLVVPFIPFYIGVLGVRRVEDVERWSGLLFAVPFFIQAVAAPLWGVLGDRYGRKIMILRAMGGMGLVSMLCAVVRTVQELLFLRTVQGGVSGFVAAANALVSGEIPPERLGVAMGVLQTSLTAGGIIGPLIGGVLADLLGYPPVFVINGLLCWVAAVVVLRGARETSRAKRERSGPGVRANLAYFLRSPALRTTGLLLCASQMSVMSIEPIFALFVQQLGVPPGRVATIAGALFSVTGIASMFGAPFWGRAADRVGEKRVLIVVQWGAAAAYAAQAAVGSPLPLLALRIALGFFIGGLLPPLYTLVARSTPPDRLGGIMGLTSSSIMLGNVLGPLLGGLLSAVTGIRFIFLVTAVVLAISALGSRGLVVAPDPTRASSYAD